MDDKGVTKIKPMSKEDIKTVAELERACFSAPWSEKALLDELHNPLARFLVYEINGSIVGYIGAFEICGECYIANICVLPEFRRRGIANALLNAAESGARERKCELITLEVRVSNKAAIELYEKNGYNIVGERRGFYSSPIENAYIMTKFFKNNGR